MRSGDCNVISLYVFCYPVNGSVFFSCVACMTVFVNCSVKPYAICLGVFVIKCDGVVVCDWRCSIG